MSAACCARARWCRPVTTSRQGRIDAARLRAVEDEAIREVVALQEDIGLRAATDGEFRRTSWHMDFIYQLGGVARTDDEIVVTFRNDEGTGQFVAAGLAVREPLHLDEPIFADDFRFLAGQVRTATPKMTLPSPSMVLFRSGTAAVDRSVYPDLDQFWADLSGGLRRRDPRARRAGLPLPAARRHEPGLHERPRPAGRAGRARRGRRARAPAQHPRRSTPRSPTGPPGCGSPHTSAAATSARPGWPRAATTTSPRRCSASSTSTPSSASSTTSARAGSPRCASCRPASRSCSGWSPPSAGASRTPTCSSGASTRPPSTSRSTSSASPRSAGSPRPSTGNVLNPHQEVDKLRLVVKVAEDVWGSRPTPVDLGPVARRSRPVGLMAHQPGPLGVA